MKKVSFCGISGSGMSALAQILALSGVEVQGSDRNFDLGRDEANKKALESVGIRIVPQDGSAITEDLDFVCASTAVEDSIADVRAAKEKMCRLKRGRSFWQKFSIATNMALPWAEPAVKPQQRQ